MIKQIIGFRKKLFIRLESSVDYEVLLFIKMYFLDYSLDWVIESNK